MCNWGFGVLGFWGLPFRIVPDSRLISLTFACHLSIDRDFIGLLIQDGFAKVLEQSKRASLKRVLLLS